jgi:hypothetical protein
MPPEDKKFWRNEVVIHQPHCAFEPHVDVAFPSYYDPKQKKMVASGQVLKVDNSSPTLHNTRWKGDDLVNPGASLSLSAGNKGITLNVKPDKVPITINCDLHKWMSGYVWALDHPFAAVTDKDGNYEIKNVPAGVDLQIVCWHEGTYVNGPKGITVKFEADKENKQDFTIKGK